MQGGHIGPGDHYLIKEFSAIVPCPSHQLSLAPRMKLGEVSNIVNHTWIISGIHLVRGQQSHKVSFVLQPLEVRLMTKWLCLAVPESASSENQTTSEITAPPRINPHCIICTSDSGPKVAIPVVSCQLFWRHSEQLPSSPCHVHFPTVAKLVPVKHTIPRVNLSGQKNPLQYQKPRLLSSLTT